MAVVAEAIRRNSILAEWLAFFTQVFIAISVEVGDDLGRGLVAQHGGLEGNTNALSIVAFETRHGFWVEPGWQMFFAHTHHLLLFTVTWHDAMRIWNAVYVGGHVFVTLGTAAWVYFFRRRAFAFIRNVMILTNVLALCIYERFPVAPPRLTQGLVFNHHPFSFQDTVFGMVNGSGQVIGTQAGYNEFSAMPSVHMAWALIVGATIVVLARRPLIKALGAIYPAIMLIAVVVTANHYLLDAAGGLFVVVAATIAAFWLDRYGKRLLQVWRGGHLEADAPWGRHA